MGCVTTKSVVSNRNSVGCSRESLPESAMDEELPRQFDAEEYAQLIADAMAKGKDGMVLKALQNSTPEQRVEIQDEYRDAFSSDLQQHCLEKMSAKYAFVACLFLRSRYHMVARQLEARLRKGTSGDVGAAEIVCSYGYLDLRNITKEYETTVVGISLDQEIADSCSGPMAEILRARLSLQVGEQHDPGPDEQARRMVAALPSNDLFEGKRLFQQCLKSNCLTDVMWSLEYFLQKCQRDITVELEKHYNEGPLRTNYIALAKLFRNRSLYIASLIHEYLGSEVDDKQMELVYWILIQDEDALKAIKNSYRTTFFETLSMDIKDVVKDPIIKRVLLRTVK